jgi:hypothetical protein
LLRLSIWFSSEKKIDFKLKLIYVWIYFCKSELNKKFESKNQFYNQKLQFLASSKINSKSKINSTIKKPNKSKSILHVRNREFEIKRTHNQYQFYF